MYTATVFRLMTISLVIGSVFTSPTKNEGLKLRILHTNDMHSRFDQTAEDSTECLSSDPKKCFGGFARLATLIREEKKSEIPTLFLNAGDTYQGTVWFSLFNWEIVSTLMNILKPDVACLGNHEFNNGISGLVPYLKNASFPIVAANLDFSNEPEMANSPVVKSTIVTVRCHSIGVVGYLTAETKIGSNPGKIIFKDEVEEVQKEVRKLQSNGVKIIIALGHSGFAEDKRIAEEVDGVDLVIGGHTNTFLYNGKEPSIEKPEGPYPVVIKQKKSGKSVYVVQAYAFTKYLGNLTIDFDKEGDIKAIEGQPRLVDGKIPQAQDVLDELEKFRPAVNALRDTIAQSSVSLDADRKTCWRQECNFGDLLTDAIIDHNVKNYKGPADKWTDAPIAFFHCGDIRESIVITPDKKVITKYDVLNALPFSRNLVKIEIPGKILREVLEWSVYLLNEGEYKGLNGAFLQYSGIKVTYDLSKERGSRVVTAEVRCSQCTDRHFEKLDETKLYTALTIDFIVNGGKNYNMLKTLKQTTEKIAPYDLFVNFLKAQSGPILQKVEGRIKFVPPKTGNKN